MNNFFKWIGILTTAVVVVLAFSILLALPTMWFWNDALVRAVSWANEIDLFTAWGLNMLCGILFKSNVSSSK
jgi:hypothetical protein